MFKREEAAHTICATSFSFFHSSLARRVRAGRRFLTPAVIFFAAVHTNADRELIAMRKGAQTLVFESKPVILSHAAIGGKKEGEGPLAAYFDFLGKDAKLSQKTFEKAESKLQELALDTAKRKLGVSYEDIDVLFAGDLLNQCISSSFAARGTSIPFLGLYGACSTMAESLLLAAAFVDAGFARTAAALTSSHFASAERQYRFPLGYGGQRTPTAQWTVTGSGCCIVGGSGSGVRIEAATIGRVQDLGIKDANNMGAAMAPAAIDTLQAHFRDLRRVPQIDERIKELPEVQAAIKAHEEAQQDDHTSDTTEESSADTKDTVSGDKHSDNNTEETNNK